METDRKREKSVLKRCPFQSFRGGAHIRDVHIYTGEIFVLKKCPFLDRCPY